MTDASTKFALEETLNQKKKALEKSFEGCLVCGKKIYPFLKKDKDRFLRIRCDYHQKKLDQIWFKDYETYISIFRGQT